MKRISVILGVMMILASCGDDEIVTPQETWDGYYRVVEDTDTLVRNTCNLLTGPYAYLARVTVDGATFTWCGVRSVEDSTNWCEAVGTWDEGLNVATLQVDSARITLQFVQVRDSQTFMIGEKVEEWPSKDCQIRWGLSGVRVGEE